jgi:hypothetical protein
MSDFAEILDAELPRVMQEVIIGLLGDTPDNDVVPARSDAAFSCRVRISGGAQADVVVSATLPLASRIAEQMFEDELAGRAPTEQDARDAVREVSNIVAGNLKPLFGDNNQLGLPEDLAQGEPASSDSQLCEATVEHPAGVLHVRVYGTL